MSALADEGFALFGGPLAGSEHGRLRAADDPWVPTEQLVTTSIEPWKMFVGAERLSTGHAATAAAA